MISLEEVLAAIKNEEELANRLKDASMGESLVDIGVDSLDILIFSHDLNEAFNIDIEIYNYQTLNDILDMVNELLSSEEKVK